MNEKYGFIVNSLQKDYEISSWNEQGEITRIEGILTIAFFISVCSHRDRKQLYLIMKIPYLVNMSVDYITDDIVIKNELTEDEEIELLRRAIIGGYKHLEWKYYQPHHERIFKKYKENIEKVKELELKVNKLEAENKILKEKIEVLTKKVEDIEKLKQENQTLKEKLGIVNSEWQIERDLAWRNNPFTGEFEQYGFPIEFQDIYVENFIFTDKGKNMCHFRFPVKGVWKEYDMPYSLFNFLKENSPTVKDLKELIDGITSSRKVAKNLMVESEQKRGIIKKEIKKTSDLPNKFQTPELLLQYFRDKLGEKYYSYSLIKIIVPFIFENSKKPFGLEEVCEYCKTKRGKKPSDATIHKHFNLLMEHNIIQRKHHGVYEVNKLSLNFL